MKLYAIVNERGDWYAGMQCEYDTRLPHWARTRFSAFEPVVFTEYPQALLNRLLYQHNAVCRIVELEVKEL